ncbi:NADH-quinone oxidoreductase subunit NuoE [candidate division KSB1 bacterium]
MEFSQESKKKLEEILSHYPTKTAAALPAVYLAQEEFGYVDEEVIEYVAGLLEVTPVFLENTVSFYTMFRGKETGKYLIQVCSTLSCSLMNSEHIVDYIKEKLNIEVGGTTPDKKFSLIKVECLGSCGTAPMMQINDDYYENLTEEKIDEILDKLT